MRNELVSIKETELESVKEALKREYANLLVLVVEKGETSDIYLVNEEENKVPYLFHSLEKVVDYRYDTTNRPTILAKIVSNRYDGVYWLAFQVAEMTRKFPNKVYEPRPFSPFLTVSKCRWDSEAKFLKGFEYLEDCTMVNIDGKNYVIEYGRHDDANEIFPMFGRCLLEKEDDGKESIRRMVIYRERLFGPFASIEEWKEGIYPYIHESYHGYFGKDEEGHILAMTIICDWLKLKYKEYPVYFEDCTRSNYEWNIKFEKPLKEVKFIRRDFERTDSETKYAATDVWRLEYADGSRAIMFNSIGRDDYPKYDDYWVYEKKQRDYDPAESKFKCFIISEDYIKEIFNAK